jgi:hypothetical protein
LPGKAAMRILRLYLVILLCVGFSAASNGEPEGESQSGEGAADHECDYSPRDAYLVTTRRR